MKTGTPPSLSVGVMPAAESAGSQLVCDSAGDSSACARAASIGQVNAPMMEARVGVAWGLPKPYVWRMKLPKFRLRRAHGLIDNFVALEILAKFFAPALNYI